MTSVALPPTIAPNGSFEHVRKAAHVLSMPAPAAGSCLVLGEDQDLEAMLYAPADKRETRLLRCEFGQGESLTTVSTTSGGLPDWGWVLHICSIAHIHPRELPKVLSEMGRLAHSLYEAQGR